MTTACLLVAWLASADAGAATNTATPGAPANAATPGAPADTGAPANATTPGAPAPAPAPASAAAPPEPAGARGKGRVEHAQAMARLKTGRFEEAAALFERAAARDPANVAYATDWGFALGKIGKRGEAEAVLRAAIDKDPRRSYAYVNLADLLAEDPGRWERRDTIVGFLDKGLEALKDDRKGRFNLILALAGFERAVGRGAAAHARLDPLLAPDAPPLQRVQRKRVLDLLDAIGLDDRAHALEDWPAPAPALALAQVARGRALEAAGRVDEAIAALEIAVNLVPSDPEAWRALGRLLATHGGALDLDRADEALRQALALEPAWSDLRELRAQIARRRSSLAPPTPAGRAAAPSEKAHALYQEAEEWIDVGDPIGLGRELLEQALADSPAFVPAAVSLYALTGNVPAATVEALHDDGPGLWALAAGVRKLGKTSAGDTEAAEKLVSPWIDRAVELDVQDARFARAVSRAAADDRAGALGDLIAYLAREPDPEHLAEARALRAGLADGPAGRSRERRPSPQLLARIRLLEDRPDAALRALGGTCAPDLPPDRLLAIGLVHEFADQRAAARSCYELASAGDDGGALLRLARLDARLDDAELRRADRRALERAAGRDIPAALWALARLAATDGDRASALAETERALALAAQDGSDVDVWLPLARAAALRWTEARRADERGRDDRRRRTELGGAASAVLVGLLFARRRWGGWTLAGALRRRPGIYPEVARAVGELRHDVLKHRAAVLGAVADGQSPRAEIERALTLPRPTSLVVAGIYDRLVQAARGAGATLRPLAREPIFGGLVRDLARAELLLPRAPPHDGRAELMAIDGRLRGAHADALAALLRLGPRTRLDAATLSRWIAAVEASTRQAGRRWIAPGLALADLDVDFPVEEDALSAIFANLLRNAEAAVATQPEARVIVRVDRERDVTGRQSVTLFVGDAAPEPLSLEAIEARESGRGLAIVRDLVRQWRGHLVVRPEPAPLAKLVGACFPL
jgi:tetratricopeptide (TPR) repeat protein